MKKLICVMLAAVFLLCSCSKESSRDFFAMDTYMQITVYGEKELTETAEKLIKDFDSRFSVAAEGGELYTLNKEGAINGVSAEFYSMLECARILFERTNGAYDITSLALTELWNKCENEGRVPTSDEIKEALKVVGMDKMSFDKTRVVLGGVKGIDLGSIAKGYAGTLAMDKLKEDGASGGILNLGGNVTVFGKKPDGESFKVGITNPNNPSETCGYVELESGNVVTSGKYNRNFKIGGRSYHHIIDARTGLPCENGVASVTVVCEDGMWADALSTALFLLGEQGAINYYNTYGGFEAVIVMDDGRIVTTSDKIKFIRNNI